MRVDALDVLRDHRKRRLADSAGLGEAWQDFGLVFPSPVGTPIGYTTAQASACRVVRLNDP